MSHSALAWSAEVQAHVPQRRDLIELAWRAPDLSEWRATLANDPDAKECLQDWEAFIRERRIAVVLEQAMEEGDFPPGRELAAWLADCPAEWRDPALLFARSAPTDVAMYLACACRVLVGIERERRTGCAEWKVQAASGSPEMLQSLMFKWGPRFQRHRRSW
ncbi:hypothetical protein HHL11_12110 [Ramlibacter sp. G-1-2-2]|uniref:Uncharacterized protein n=1 Tax=Ramlibacter agri TaxID=2728837 RepID=A0A848H5G9_9BURK|nr:hypothetical protein [Ramlibacter agri]NML44500.1 hypothetical protein [Ramlibacter agri]